jgi:hypothetical protein
VTAVGGAVDEGPTGELQREAQAYEQELRAA